MKYKILLVDDEKDVRDMLNLSLSAMGYEVMDAEDGNKALNIFRDAHPQIVLTDIKMPGMDGIELLQKIKREDHNAEVIMITGHGDMDLAIKSLKYEATDFVAKPINLDALKIALKRSENNIITRKQLSDYTENLERLVREKTELQDHLASLGLMISSISHGVKGLLTALDAGIHKLDSGLARDDHDRIEKGFDILKITVERIRKMILDIIYYAKERGLDRSRVDIAGFGEEVYKVIEPKISGQPVELIKDFDLNIGTCEFDDEHMHSALVTILENAIDACVKDKSKKTHRVHFKISQENNELVFEIADDGVGIEREALEKIFTPFFSTKGNKGTGLGLFIANKIVEQHGGKINVKSTPGHGACFTVMIPKTGKGADNPIKKQQGFISI
ncbi:MAG: hybrid sensor histidine kinase/response regulator [Deltaproteobacteria bacterium]|nr:hybrid sensor histidine kinase/response regulator [Deltaproteobacteria bacterium]